MWKGCGWPNYLKIWEWSSFSQALEGEKWFFESGADLLLHRLCFMLCLIHFHAFFYWRIYQKTDTAHWKICDSDEADLGWYWTLEVEAGFYSLLPTLLLGRAKLPVFPKLTLRFVDSLGVLQCPQDTALHKKKLGWAGPTEQWQLYCYSDQETVWGVQSVCTVMATFCSRLCWEKNLGLSSAAFARFQGMQQAFLPASEISGFSIWGISLQPRWPVIRLCFDQWRRCVLQGGLNLFIDLGEALASDAGCTTFSMC